MRATKYRDDFIAWEGDSAAFSFPQTEFDFEPENMTITLSGFLSRIKYEHQGAMIHKKFKEAFFTPQYAVTPSPLQNKAIPFKPWVEDVSVKDFISLYDFLSPETADASEDERLTSISAKMEDVIKQSRSALRHQFHQERMRVEMEQEEEELWYENLPDTLKNNFTREAFSTFWEHGITKPFYINDYVELFITPYRETFGHLVPKPVIYKEVPNGETKEKIDYLQWAKKISSFLNFGMCPNAAMRVYGTPKEFYRGWKPEEWGISPSAKLYPLTEKGLSGENVKVIEHYLDESPSSFLHNLRKVCFGGIANEFPIFYKGKKDSWLVLRECAKEFPRP